MIGLGRAYGLYIDRSIDHRYPAYLLGNTTPTWGKPMAVKTIAQLKKELHKAGIKTYTNKTKASYVKKEDVKKILAGDVTELPSSNPDKVDENKGADRTKVMSTYTQHKDWKKFTGIALDMMNEAAEKVGKQIGSNAELDLLLEVIKSELAQS